MSGKATGWVLQHFPIATAADRNRKLVLLSVADAANQYGETARVAVDVVCDEWGFDSKTVRRHLTDLAAEGWLEVEQESRGRGGPKVYRLPRMLAGITGQNARQSEGLLAGSIGPESEKLPANTADPTSLTTNGSNGTRPAVDSTLSFSAEFEDWWKVYPRREGTRDKPGSKKNYLARRRAKVPRDDLFAAARQYAAERDGGNPTFTMGARKFLDGPEGEWTEALARSRGPREDDELTTDELAQAIERMPEWTQEERDDASWRSPWGRDVLREKAAEGERWAAEKLAEIEREAVR